MNEVCDVGTLETLLSDKTRQMNNRMGKYNSPEEIFIETEPQVTGTHMLSGGDWRVL